MLGHHTPTGQPARATGLPSGPGPAREGRCLSLAAAAKRPHHHDGPESNHTIPRQPHSPRTTDPALPTLRARTWVGGGGSPRARPAPRPCSWPGTSRPSVHCLLHVQSQTSPSRISTEGNDWNKTNRPSLSEQEDREVRAQKPVCGHRAPGTTRSLGPPSALAPQALRAGLPLQLLSLLTDTAPRVRLCPGGQPPATDPRSGKRLGAAMFLSP